MLITWLLLLSTIYSTVLSSEIPIDELKYETKEFHYSGSVSARDVLPGTLGERARRIPPIVEPLHYYIRVTPYFQNDFVPIPKDRNMTFDGVSSFIFKVKKSTNVITLHSLLLNYSKIEVFDSDGLPLMDNVQPSFNTSLNHIMIPLNFYTEVGKIYVIRFTYVGGIHDYLDTGLYYTYYDDVGGKRHYMLATHMEPARARWVFPCLDEPAYKAVFHITLVYPTGYVALANAMERKPVPMGNLGPGEGWEEIQFPPSLKMSTYLVAFAVGPYVNRKTYSQDGTLIRIWGWTGQEEYLQFAAEISAKCIYTMGKYTNFKYPYIKSDQLGLPQFVAGAMENYGLIIYKYQYISFNKRIHTTFTKQAAAKVICHELAHQWFGDTVTAMWWDDLFLQEGFAAFFQRFNLALALPEQKTFIDAKLLTENVENGLDADADLAESHPLYYWDGPAFDHITYEKGASILHMILSVLGPKDFQKALQNYIQAYKFSNADHQMLFEQFTKTSKNVKDWCGRPLNATLFLNPWFLQQGFPLITLTNDQPTGQVTFTQQPFNNYSSLPSSPTYNYSWPVPFFWANSVTSYLKPTKKMTWLPPAYESCPNQEMPLTKASDDTPLENVHWELGNAGLSSHVRVEYDDVGFERMFNRLKLRRDEDFSIADQIMLIGDQIALLKRKMDAGEPFSYKKLIDVLKVLIPGAPNFGPFEMATRVIKPLEKLFMDGPDYELFKRCIQTLLIENYKMLGFNVTNDWNTDITRFMMLPFAVRYETGTSGQDAFKIFKRFLAECGQSTTGVDNCTTIHPDIRKAVYCAGAKYGDQQAFNTLRNLYDGQVKYDFYFYTEYYAMLEGMSCSNRRNDIFDTIPRAMTAFRMPPGKYRVPLLFYIVWNPKGSQWLAEYLQENSASVLASDNLDEYIDALTSTWYSQARLDQFDELTRSLQLTTDQQKIFEKYHNRTVEQVRWWKNYFPIVSRAFYDDFVIGPFDMENWQKRLQHNFEPISYNLTVRPHFPGAAQYPWYQNFTFNGHVDITFKVLKSGAKLVLNSHRMVIEAANMILKRSDADKTYKISSIRKDLVNAFLYIDTDAPFTANSVWILSIDYVGFIFAKPSKGVYTNTNYFEFNDKKAWIFSTYFESGPSARSLVPCFDEPNYKARWQVTLDHPADMIALGNMPDEGFKVSKDGWSTTYFPLTPPMSSYLLAVAVGHFASLETVSETGVLVRAWAWTGMEVYAEHALKAVVGEVDFMATHFDFPFPLPKLDVLALPQYTTMKGAEEHWGLIHVAYRRELLDPLYATAATYADVANVCAHETVHQWFGDLVTTVFWPRIFLNEAFANYWETNGVERAFPEQAKYNKFERYHKGLLGFAADSKIGTSKPVIPDAPKYFTAIPYNKGASLLNMLSNTISPRVMKLGLRNYLHKYQYKNVNDTQLWSELTKVADDEHLPSWDDQPLNVATLMDPWMYQATYPVLKLTAKDGQVTYSQEPFILNTSALQPSPYNFEWTIPVFSQLQKGGEVFHYFRGKDGENPFWTRQLTNEWQVENPAFKGFYRVWYDADTWTPILNQLQDDPLVFDELTRAQFLSDAIALQQRGSLDWNRVMDIVATLQKEGELAAWYTFKPTLELFMEMFQNTDVWDKLTAFIGRIISEQYSSLGWQKTGDWSHDILASYLTEWACRINHGDCRQVASQKFKEFITDCQRSETGTGRCNQVYPEERPTQYCWGTYANPNAEDVITEMYRWFEIHSKYFDRDAQNLLNGMACTTNPERLNSMIKGALRGSFPSSLIGYLGDHDDSRSLLWKFFVSNRDEVIFGDVESSYYMLAAMKKWNAHADKQKAETYLAENAAHLSESDKAAIQTGIASVQERIDWLAKNKAPIADWLTKLE